MVAGLTLFHGWRSSASRRVRLCLAEKGLAFDSKVIDLVKGEHHSPEFLRLNPNGVIPLLILEDGRALYESGTICEYVDETGPEPPLRPADAYGRAEMRNWIRHVDGLIGNLIIFNWVHGMAQVAQKWTDAELAERLARIPSKARDKLKTALLDRMEEASGPSGWLVGDRYSLADIGAVPFVKRIDEEIAPDEMTRARHPKVAAWWAAIQARPAFATARIEAFTGGG
jgi:glutathione S-transferase